MAPDASLRSGRGSNILLWKDRGFLIALSHGTSILMRKKNKKQNMGIIIPAIRVCAYAVPREMPGRKSPIFST